MVYLFTQYLHIVGMLCGLGALSLPVQAVYPSKQPIVQVSIAQKANKFIVNSSTTLDAGPAYVSKIVYNTDGRISQQIWPTGLAASNLYDNIGTLTEMRLAPSNQLLWQRGSNNARGQFTSVTYGNGIQTRNTYEPQTGLQTASQAGPASSPQDASITNHSYPSYNALGHLVQRNDANHATQEIFAYDSLNRLTC